jgi:acetyl esterase/lipase
MAAWVQTAFVMSAALLISGSSSSSGRQSATRPVIRLWAGGAPGARGHEEADKPSLTVYQPAGGSNGTAVVVCPGGGYRALAVDHEGRQVAEWLNAHGVTAFVLRYRLAPRYHHPAPLQDVQRAIRTVRARAGEWKVSPERIGVWGFSAGGHLASTAGTQFDEGRPGDADPVERVSCRPDFLVLSYPVITLKAPYAHGGSRDSLLGQGADPALVESLSSETRVTPRTPPTFLMHTDADRAVVPENSVLFYLALRKAGVPAELHVYQKGPHGVGLAPRDPVLSWWPDALAAWMRANGWLPDSREKGANAQRGAEARPH